MDRDDMSPYAQWLPYLRTALAFIVWLRKPDIDLEDTYNFASFFTDRLGEDLKQ